MFELRRKVFSVLFILFCSAFMLQSQEVPEEDTEVMSLGGIDHLISISEYSQALEQLSLYIQKYPEQFDKAQKRISKILKYRNAFNLQAGELAQKMRQSAEAQNLTDEQADELDAQKMDIILALENSEKNPAQEETDLTNDARRTVRLSYYINRSNMIVNQGTALINEADSASSENYGLAFDKFREGINLKTNDSDVVYNGQEEIQVVYPDDLKRSVNAHILQVKNFSLSVKSQLENCQNLYNEYVAAVNSLDFNLASELLESVKAAFTRLASTRNTLYREGNELKKLDERARILNPGLGDTSYITFSRWAVSGVEGNPDSGMTGAVEAFFNTRIEGLKNVLYEAVLAEYKNIGTELKLDSNELFSVGDYSSVLTMRDCASGFALQSGEINSLYSKINDSRVKDFTLYNSSLAFIQDFSKKNFTDTLSVSKKVFDINEQVKNRTVVNGNFAKFGQDSLASAQSYGKQLSDIRIQAASKNTADEKLSQENYLKSQEEKGRTPVKRNTAGETVEDKKLSWTEVLELYDKIILFTEEECINQGAHVWSVLAKTYSDEADSQLAAFTLRNVEANTLLNGVEETVGEGKITKYYPTKAAQICTQLNSDIQKQKTILTGYRTTLNGGAAYSNVESTYTSSTANIDHVIASLDELTVNNNQLITTAKIKANEARIAVNEARLRFDQAVKYLNSNKYDEARQSLSEADESYKKSLLLEENDSFRREFSAKISQTDEQITVRQNEWVITTTRALITDAYNDYYSGNFENSKHSLDEASAVWEKTQAQENTEIAELMVLVKEALESTGGKEIAFSDPLYKDMGAFLNNARVHYEDGAKLFNSGKTEEGTALLKQARDETRKVQRVFPKNMQANNLNLLINKILDPAVYENNVAQKINQAKTTAGSNRVVDMQTALKDLKDLHEIIPDNKKVSDAVKELEVQLARSQQSEQIKKDMARSDALTRQAQKETNIARKVALLDEALSLNRRNTLAQKLKDQAYISNSAGKTVKNFLNDADEIRYSQAERYYNDGMKDQASALINDLFKRNPQVSKVIKLKRRIENM